MLKGAIAARARGVEMLKKLRKGTLGVLVSNLNKDTQRSFYLLLGILII